MQDAPPLWDAVAFKDVPEGHVAFAVMEERSTAERKLGVTIPELPFLLYLCCGERREGDFGEAAWEQGLCAVMIDPKVGGDDHDLTQPAVVEALLEVAAMPNCVGLCRLQGS